MLRSSHSAGCLNECFIILLITKNKMVPQDGVEHERGPAGLILKRQHEISRTSETFYVGCEMKFGTCTPSSRAVKYKFTQRETDPTKEEERARDRHDRCLSRCPVGFISLIGIIYSYAYAVTLHVNGMNTRARASLALARGSDESKRRKSQ